jgi:hypothetical protein
MRKATLLVFSHHIIEPLYPERFEFEIRYIYILYVQFTIYLDHHALHTSNHSHGCLDCSAQFQQLSAKLAPARAQACHPLARAFPPSPNQPEPPPVQTLTSSNHHTRGVPLPRVTLVMHGACLVPASDAAVLCGPNNYHTLLCHCQAEASRTV